MSISHDSGDAPHRDGDVLEQMYWGDGMTISEMSECLGVSGRCIRDWMDRHGIERRSRKQACLRKVPRFASECESAGDAGYERWRHQYDGETHIVKHHRLLAVAYYGFEAVQGKAVHHKNEIKWDNRPENLQLLSPSDHASLHKIGKIDAPWQNEEVLRDLYHNQGLSQSEIGDKLGCDQSTIHHWMNKHNIQSDPPNGYSK